MRATRLIAVLGVTVVAAPAGPAAAGAAVRGARSPAARPATVAYSFPQQCVVIPVVKDSFDDARAVLHGLGCLVRRSWQSSSVRKDVVIGVVGGDRSYAYGHVVTLIVSSGPAT
jgi:hypothetical protein